MEKYYDKHGGEIKAGMTLRHDDGDTEYVYPCESADGEKSIGFNASNENFIGFTESEREIYPIHQFNLKEWEIVREPIILKK